MDWMVPTAVASCPVYRWQKPPILACWYACPVRFSNSRIKYMSRSHLTSVCGDSWSLSRPLGALLGAMEGLAVTFDIRSTSGSGVQAGTPAAFLSPAPPVMGPDP